MLDIILVRDNPEIVKEDLKKRGSLGKLKMVDELLVLDKRRRENITLENELRRRRNRISEEVGRLRKEGGDITDRLREAKEIPEKIKDVRGKVVEAEAEMRRILYRLPNILHPLVPIGDGEEDNQQIRSWGKKRAFDFEPKDHIDLGLNLDLIDVERAGKVAGTRFYYLKKELVQLNYALMKFALDFMAEKGFLIYQPPYMLRRRGVESSTDLADFEDVIYKIEDEDLYLLPTSEFALLALHMDEILHGKELPLRYSGISPCFRKEAGTHGRDTKGVFRVHQFEKVEQFLFSRPEESWEEHEKLISNAEEVFQKLRLPYRVMNVCTGDIGSVAAKKYDLEAWLPGQGKYREMVSCSNCTDYQARRANIRFRDSPSEPTRHVHTLNSTLVATERTLIAIMENYQLADGSIEIPKALVPYMNGLKVIQRKT
jgi:seryl-tRNA synthetase